MTPRTEPHVHVGEPHVQGTEPHGMCMNRTSVPGEGRTGPKWSKKYSDLIFLLNSMVNRAVQAVQWVQAVQ